MLFRSDLELWCLSYTFGCVSLCGTRRYRAVASWSRVQGVGVPLLTAIEIISIWVLSLILAVPEAIGFNMVDFDFNNMTIRTCMIKPESAFIRVRAHSRLPCPFSPPIPLLIIVSCFFHDFKRTHNCSCWHVLNSIS